MNSRELRHIEAQFIPLLLLDEQLSNSTNKIMKQNCNDLLKKKKKKIRKIERIVVTLGITQTRMIPLPEIVIFQSLFSQTRRQSRILSVFISRVCGWNSALNSFDLGPVSIPPRQPLPDFHAVERFRNYATSRVEELWDELADRTEIF